MITSLLAAIALSGMATAQTLTIADVEAIPGEQVSFSLTVDVQGGTYSGFQFQMQFPAEGFIINGTTVSSNWDGGSFGVGDLVAGTANGSACSMSDTAIPDGEQEIGTVKFTVASTVPVGDYDVTVSGFHFLDGTNYTPVADVTFHVHVVTMHAVVLDETSTAAPEATGGAVNVRVKRTIKANEWSSICLPFAMTAEQIQTAFGEEITVELADAVSYDTTEDDDENIVGITINFNNVSPLTIEANHPYIIKVSSAVSSFDVDGVVVNPATSVSGRRKKIGTGSYFIGNYENQTEVPEFCLFLNGNKFWYSTGATKMKAFRGYFSLRDVLTEVDEAAARISFSFGEATDINSLTPTPSPKGEGSIYDLQGRKVEKPGKGIYVKDGKKMVVK